MPINVQPFPDSLRTAMQAARNGAPQGAKKQAMAAVLVTALGASPRAWFTQDGAVVAEVEFTGAPSINPANGEILIGERAWTTLVKLLSANRANGVWKAYFTDSGKTTGAIIELGTINPAVALSADLVGSVAGGTFSTKGVWGIGWDPSYDLSTAGSTTTLSANDSRLHYEIDPARAIYQQRYTALLQAVAARPNPALSTFTSDSAVYNGRTVLERVANPVDSTKKCFQHRIYADQGGWDGGPTYRSEITSPDGTTDVARLFNGTSYWTGFAFIPGPEFASGTDNGMGLWDCHTPYYEGNNNGGPSPAAILLGRKFTPVSSYSAGTSNPVHNFLASQTPSTTEWNYIITQQKLHYDVAQHPFFRMWWVVGESAAITSASRIVNIVDQPCGYLDTNPWTYFKFGIYNFSGWTADPQQLRTLKTKGVRIWKDLPGTPTLTESEVLAFMRSI